MQITLPSLLVMALVASLYGALYHLVRGGGPGRLFFYLLLAWLGFAGGQFLGLWRGWTFFSLGQVSLGMGTLGSLAALLTGDWLSHIRVTPTQPDGGNRV